MSWHPFRERRRKQVLAALDALGSTTAEVAEALRRREIKGLREKAFHCPIARYVKSEFPEYKITVTAGTTYVDHPDTRPSADSWFVVPNPEPVREFVHDFDLGRFPALEEARAVNYGFVKRAT